MVVSKIYIENGEVFICIFIIIIYVGALAILYIFAVLFTETNKIFYSKEPES